MTDLREQLADVIEVAIDNAHDMDVTHRDYANASADAIIAAGMMQQWRPIETAPTDEHTDCLLWVADAGKGGEIATGYVAPSFFRDGVTVKARGYGGEWDITHWMPLPAAPGVQGGEA